MKKSRRAKAYHALAPCFKFLLLMKVSFFIILVTCLQVSAKTYSQEKFSLHFKQAEVTKILTAIQKQSKYRFFYNNGYIDKLGKVDLDVKDSELESILKMVLGSKFNFVINDQESVIISPTNVDEFKENAADSVIKGKITDENGKGLGGVTIKVKNANKAVTTDENGNFSIAVSSGAELLVSYVGYKEQSVTVKGQKSIAVQLQLNAAGLGEVVVVGYGTQKRRDVTGTISRVKGDEIKNLPVSNPAQALQGRASGVDVVRDDGAPGAGYSVRIRGTGTINNSDPLYVVDGVPLSNLNSFNSNEIASIEILKDASSSAIYGSRAANGVVLITTKKGSFNDGAKLSANLYTGQNKAMKYLNMLTAPDLATLKKESYTNDALPVPNLWSDPYYSTQRTDWQKALMGNTGKVQNADVSLQGGNNVSQFYFSGNYYNETGIIPNSFFKRYSFRINSEHKIGSRFKIGENIAYSNTNGIAPDTKSTQAGLVWSAIRFNPAIPVVNPDGSWGTSKADNQLGDINNPVATASETQSYNKTDRLLANAYAELEIIKGLKLRANYGFDHSINDSYSFSNALPNQTRTVTLASLGEGFYKNKSLLEEYYLSYNKKFGEHDVTFTGGYSAQNYSGNNFSASRSGFADTSYDQRILNLGNTSSQGNGGANDASWGLQSYFVRANYSFNSKYLLTATMRADGSSKFAPGKRWGYFPAFSAGWRISDENFFKNSVHGVDVLKLTGGWGELGNQNIGDFQYLSQISGGYSYNFGTGTVNQLGTAVTSLANPNITWERAVMTNISLEIGVLKNHLNAIFTYYNKNTSDMLVPYSLVETYGAQVHLPDDGGNITLPNQNIGQLNNHGVEIDLNYNNSIGKLNYSINANGAFMRNKVTKLYGSKTYLGSTPYGRENADISRTYEGQPIASFFGYKTAGLYQSQADIDSDPNVASDPNKANIKPGDVRFVDITGPTGKKDGVIDDNDRVRLGDPNPHFVYGFSASLNYMNFDFSFHFAGSAGFQLFNADRLAGLDASQVFNWYADQKNRWTGAGTSNSIPRLSKTNLNNNYRSSDMWVQSGAYLSLKNISLGYTLKKQKIGEVQLPAIRVYVSSYNVFFLTKYKGYTPELGYNNSNLQRGVDLAQYPQNRNLTIGATINF